MEDLEEAFVDMEFESETGLPAIARKYSAGNDGINGPFIPM